MKSQKINDGLWSVTTANGNYAHLTKCFDGWEVSCWSADGQTLLCHGGVHDKRFDAKVEAERLLGEG